MSKRRALLSVSAKDGIAAFARDLVDMGWEVLSTGGTARALAEAGVAATEVATVTEHPEMMEGRVKTLHPAVHAGILARRAAPDDMDALARQGYVPIDLVAVNLYPFRETIAEPGVTVEAAMDDLDVGGPAMLRAAAKNHRDVWIVCDPADYDEVAAALAGTGEAMAGEAATQSAGPSAADLRRRLAAKAFALTADYDAAASGFLAEDESAGSGRPPPRTLRYGENPGQPAAFHAAADSRGLAALRQLQGKELSYNNFLDMDGALRALAPFAFCPKPAAAVVKHTTPCGLATGASLADAFLRARGTDPVSAYGSVVAFNRAVDTATAAEIAAMFVECVVAPSFSAEARAVLARKKNLRLLAFPETDGEGKAGEAEGAKPHPMEPSRSAWWRGAGDALRAAARFLARAAEHPGGEERRSVYGGLLAQSPPALPFYGAKDGCSGREDALPRGEEDFPGGADAPPDAKDGAGWRVVTRRRPTETEMDDLAFAWAVVAAVKSNAIVLAKDGATLGIGGGQTSRLDASRLAVRKVAEAGLAEQLKGASMASDAFFPFRDAVDEAARAGVCAVVQPGGSIRDQEVVDAADEHGIAMAFTGQRLFRH